MFVKYHQLAHIGHGDEDRLSVMSHLLNARLHEKLISKIPILSMWDLWLWWLTENRLEVTGKSKKRSDDWKQSVGLLGANDATSVTEPRSSKWNEFETDHHLRVVK